MCYLMQVHVPDSQWGQTKQNIAVWTRERFIAGPCKENGWLVLKNPEFSSVVGGEVLKGQICGESCRMCELLLIGWCRGNRGMLQETCDQPEIIILHLAGGLSSGRSTQRYYYIQSLGRNQDAAPRQHYCFLIPPLFLHSFPSLIHFGCSVVSDSLWTHELQHARLPCPSATPLWVWEFRELAQTHVHWVSDAIQLSHPLSSPSPPAFNLSQHQGLFQGVSSSHLVAKV